VHRTIGSIVIDDYPVDDALYMAVITVATVGYAEIRPLSHAGACSTLILVGRGAMLLSEASCEAHDE
jgi:voltage-gated potassium channel